MEQIVLGIDPGNTTGVAIIRYKDGEFNLQRSCVIVAHIDIWRFLNEIDIDRIVMESFHLYENRARAQVNSSFYTVEVIGIVKLHAQLRDIPLKLQTAQYGKSVWDDKHLKKFNLWPTGPSAKHERDAIRHVATNLKLHRLPQIREMWND